MRRLISLFAIWLVVGSSSLASDAPSGYRHALLIGNNDYGDLQLNGVEASLDQLESALGDCGFAIQRHTNLDENALKEAGKKFIQRVPTNGIALVYFVGLGASLERSGKTYNLLRPIAAKIESDNDYRSRAWNLGEFITSLQRESGSRANLIYVDACWDSPLKPSKGNFHVGLTEFAVGADTVVMFAARSQSVLPLAASDNATALAAALAKNCRQLNESVSTANEGIGNTLPQAWCSGKLRAGLGIPPAPPVEQADQTVQPASGFVSSTGLTLRWCPPGEFTMGSEETEVASTRDRAAVTVQLSTGFWMGEHEVTQREYYLVMRKTVPTGFTTHKNAPFWGVGDTKQVADFCKKLTELDRKNGIIPNGWSYACPTEAEWEYACRAGTQTRFCFGDSPSQLGSYGNFADRSLWEANPNHYWAQRDSSDGFAESLAPVGSYQPNAWGIRDMHGNVAELVSDNSLVALSGGKDPLVRVEKNGRTIMRGGAWCSRALYCESSFRNLAPTKDKHNFVGFRVVLKKTKK